MRVLLIHNYYQQAGGEDQVFQAESDLLKSNGHPVWHYTLNNDQIGEMSAIALLGNTIWNQQVYQELRSLIQQHQIQVAHFHNTFPLISPSAYYACKAEQVPVIQTCHNYRLLCPNAMFLRDGKVCEDCMGKSIPLPSIQHKCYRNSRIASAGVAAMLATHRLAQTWHRQINTYIALTEFARQKLIQGGIPADKVIVKPNFVHPDPGCGEGKGGYALFVGRLSTEKGIDLLLSAWQHLGHKIPLKIVGDGPLANQVANAVNSTPGLLWLGRKSMEDVYDLMKEALFLVFPSRWYEGLPRTIIESFAVGTPVIAANLGSMASLITPEETGLHFRPRSVEDLIAKVEWATNNLDTMLKLRQKARTEFIEQYTAEESYRKLLDVYTQISSTQTAKDEIKL
ncbi:MAG: glycosyltransferase [Leptolyngbyaceae cyanobacterium]